MKRSLLIASLACISLLVAVPVYADEDTVITTPSVPPVPCTAEKPFTPQGDLLVQQTCPPGYLNCYVNCKGVNCCPSGYPYLNYCDCQCYPSSPNCSIGYAVCR
jgi:hypothetical protein